MKTIYFATFGYPEDYGVEFLVKKMYKRNIKNYTLSAFGKSVCTQITVSGNGIVHYSTIRNRPRDEHEFYDTIRKAQTITRWSGFAWILPTFQMISRLPTKLKISRLASWKVNVWPLI